MARPPIYKHEGKVIEREKGAHEKGKSEAARGGGGEEVAGAKKGLAEDKGAGGGRGNGKALAEDKGAHEAGKEGREEGLGEDKHGRHMNERKEMSERQESERRDHHNTHREAMRKMHHRHETEHHDMNERHMAELSQQAGGEVEGQEPMAEQAQGGGAQSPASA